MKGTPAVVVMSKGTIDLYTGELHESHRLLDTVGVPQSGYEEQLSISQRVGTLVSMYKSLKARVEGQEVRR